MIEPVSNVFVSPVVFTVWENATMKFHVMGFAETFPCATYNVAVHR
jgi:hypothetical protein